MALRLGDVAPDFSAETTTGPIDSFPWKAGSWAVLFSHPQGLHAGVHDRTRPVAGSSPSSTSAASRSSASASIRSTRTSRWAGDIKESQGNALNFPLIADPDKTVANLYGMIHPNASDTATVRSVFVIGPDNKVKLTLTYPASTGRNFHELLRVIDSLQLTAKHQVATPADWKQGEDVIIVPAVSDDEAKKRFPGYVAKKPYLRVTPCPE